MPDTPAMRSFTVSAPASSGNLGPGFDVLGMALELRSRVRTSAGTGKVIVRGEGAGSLPEDGENLVARAFDHSVASHVPDIREGLDLECDNRIPIARGLGSSTAAAACGLIAGWTAVGHSWDPDELARELALFDGHPDNAAACAHGGIVVCRDIAVGDADPDLDVVALGPAPWIIPIALVPDQELATAAARAVLPVQYDPREVTRTLAAMGLLLAGLVGGHPELVADALEGDHLHEPPRAQLVPQLAEVRDSLKATEALGATLSGAGPTVLVWCEPDTVDQALGSLAIDLPDLQALRLEIAETGARVD